VIDAMADMAKKFTVSLTFCVVDPLNNKELVFCNGMGVNVKISGKHKNTIINIQTPIIPFTFTVIHSSKIFPTLRIIKSLTKN
jgi:hypothetical protein